MKISKRMKLLSDSVDRDKLYSVDDGLALVKDTAKAKFDESVDASVNLGIDAKKSDQSVRGSIVLPNGTGKTTRVAVFAQGDAAEAAKKAGADIVGYEDLAQKIKAGEMNFDVVIATPDTMKVVSPLGQILGPKGLMPNPKSETVTKDIPNTVKNAKSGQIRYKSDKQGIIHARIGQIGYTEEQLKDNLEAFLTDVKKAKPPSAKGVYISKVTLSSTMGKGFEIDTAKLNF